MSNSNKEIYIIPLILVKNNSRIRIRHFITDLDTPYYGSILLVVKLMNQIQIVIVVLNPLLERD